MFISSNFDSGNIEVVACEDAGNIQLNISTDHNSDFYQWFHFRLCGSKGLACKLQILNAGGAAYPPGFEDYRVVYSYDRENWLRTATTLTRGVLSIEFTAEYDSVYFAYFAPYSMERHHDLVAKSQLSPRCQHRLLGQTLDGQDLDLLSVSHPASGSQKKNCWITARQHPGESMAEWWMEGALEWLLDENNPDSLALLERANVHLVPNMNPDGSRRGHLRTNAAGANLNREWASPNMERSPEVFLVKNIMQEIGVDFMLDVHGDESLPFCFIAGTEGLSDWDQTRQAQLDFYKRELANLNPDFQTARGYPPKPPGTGNLTMSTVQSASNHGCLAMTLEMPFKDTSDTPDVRYGWSPARSKKLAHSCLQVLDSYLQSGLVLPGELVKDH